MDLSLECLQKEKTSIGPTSQGTLYINVNQQYKRTDIKDDWSKVLAQTYAYAANKKK